MHIQPIFLIVLLVFKMAQLKHYKKVAPNDLFVGILIVYLLIQSLTSNTKEFHTPGATDNLIDPQAWTNLHILLRDLYSDGKLTIPGNVHILGDLLVGTYKDENGVEKDWENSIEHACVWNAEKDGADTSAAKWMNTTTTQSARAQYAKPSAGGGVFSFRAGHIDLYSTCISRKQPRMNNLGGKVADANSRIMDTTRKWNKSGIDVSGEEGTEIHFLSAVDLAHNQMQRKHRIKHLQRVYTQGLYTDDMYRAEYRGANASDAQSAKIRIHDEMMIGWGKSLYVNGSLQVDGWAKIDNGLCLPSVRDNNPSHRGSNVPQAGRYGWLFRTGDNDEVKIWDDA